jgi:hypothetical protein
LNKCIKKGKSGAAMIAVLCFMMIVVTLSLALLLAASVLIKTSMNKSDEEQCSISASTMSKEIERQLSDTTSNIYQYMKANIIVTNASSSLWPYYNTDELGHGEKFNVYRNFNMSTEDASKTGTVTAKMFWEWEHNGEVKDIVLHVEITIKKGNESDTISSLYGLDVDDTKSSSENWRWYLEERY